MRNKNSYFIIFILFFSLSCKKQNKIFTKNEVSVINPILSSNILNDTIINNINDKKLNNIKNEDREKIIQLYFDSFQKDSVESNIMLDGVRKNHIKIDVKKYIDLDINKNLYSTYLLSFPYENDEIYRALLLVNADVSNGIIIYEKVVDEGEYLRISKIKDNTIKNFLYNIEYYNYDKAGNIISNKKQKDSTLIKTNSFIINKNSFQQDVNSKLNEKWYGKLTCTINENNEDWQSMQDVVLTINSNFIFFHVEGYQIAQDYKLRIMDIKNNQIKLFYDSPLNGDESAVLQKTKDFGVLNYDGEKYTWSCPYIDESFTNGKKNIYFLKKEK